MDCPLIPDNNTILIIISVLLFILFITGTTESKAEYVSQSEVTPV